jgi:alpha-L-fucosidase
MRRTIAALMTMVAVGAHASEPVAMTTRAEELKNLRWGMFICWSFSTFSGKEWTPGVAGVDFFKATDVDTDQWARTAKEANMGYILFLTKHHDGFCLWDTKTTDRKVTKAPLGRDVLAELRKSCDKYGIKLALYFSEGEFNDNKNYHPGGYTPDMKKAQLKELLTQYGPIEYIWFDHAQTDGGLGHNETVQWCKQFQPGCFIGFNHGAKAGDIRLGEMGRPGPVGQKTGIGADHGNAAYNGYLLAEFTYPILPSHQGGAQWFYSLPKHDNLCLPVEKLYADYLGAVKYGNIFSIDVGPDYAGKLRAIDIETLRRVGEMIRNPPPLPLSAGAKASASSVWGPGYEADKSFDGDEGTRWGAAPESRSGWLEADLGEPTEIGQAVVMEIEYPRTEQFAIEWLDGTNWKPLVTGTAIAGRRAYSFAPVKAQRVRLNIIKAGEVPTIEEFQLFPPGAKLPDSLQADAKKEARLKWFHEAKYGLFINWGLYSIPAGEWKGKPIGGIGEWIMHNARIPVKEYEQLAKQFNPAKFNADEWAQLAVDAGMKYLVFDCKHHDGFALFRSAVTNYNCYDATPWKRDPFKELQAACEKRGIKLCFYYSQATDWHEPNGANNNWDFPPNDKKDFDQYLRDKSFPQVRELLSNYGPIGLIWFDVPTLMTPERSKRLAEFVHSIQPDVLINSRLGPGGYHDYQSRGDNEIPGTVTPGAWETAATINDTWGFKKDDHKWKTPEDICFKLVDIVSKGGNYLLNVGPDGDGLIPQPSQDILLKVGAWLKVNGEAIYGAGRTPFGEELKGSAWRCTTRALSSGSEQIATLQGEKLYIHFFQWPGAKFELPGVKARIKRACLLANPGQALPFTQADERVTVELPVQATNPIATVLCLECNP